jgi:hypothetical protein
VTRYDKLAWEIIESRPIPQGELAEHFGLAKSGRAASFLEVEQAIRDGSDFHIEFPQFLDEFYLFKRAEFFADEPRDYFDRRTRAWFAGVVEYLCRRFKLAVPNWIEKPEYFLPQPWHKSHDDTGEPEFRRRNIGYNPRHLIRL